MTLIDETMHHIITQAKRNQKTIVLPESGDLRVVEAASLISQRELAKVVLIGERSEVLPLARANDIDLADVAIENHRESECEYSEKYIDALMARHEKKSKKKSDNLIREKARQQLADPLIFAMLKVACGDADGCVAGAVNTTSDVLRAALQIIGAKSPNEENNLVSSFFIMQHDREHQALRGTVLFADCAMVIEPNAAQLARIAMDTSDSAVALLGMTPRVALLSFSTAGSASHAQVDKVREAGNLIARQRPDLELMTEVQFDAAVIPEILRRKAPDIAVEAPANLFIFPDLQSANIGYKIAERIGGARAIGPILQGLNRPVNDLSRGCSVDDIVQLVAVTALQSRAH